jgi:hypothetical protein
MKIAVEEAQENNPMLGEDAMNDLEKKRPAAARMEGEQRKPAPARKTAPKDVQVDDTGIGTHSRSTKPVARKTSPGDIQVETVQSSEDDFETTPPRNKPVARKTPLKKFEVESLMSSDDEKIGASSSPAARTGAKVKVESHQSREDKSGARVRRCNEEEKKDDTGDQGSARRKRNRTTKKDPREPIRVYHIEEMGKEIKKRIECFDFSKDSDSDE